MQILGNSNAPSAKQGSSKYIRLTLHSTGSKKQVITFKQLLTSVDRPCLWLSSEPEVAVMIGAHQGLRPIPVLRVNAKAARHDTTSFCLERSRIEKQM